VNSFPAICGLGGIASGHRTSDRHSSAGSSGMAEPFGHGYARSHRAPAGADSRTRSE